MPLPRRPRAVAFDLDGTLIDSERLVRDAHHAAAARFGVPFTDAQFLSLVGQSRQANDARLRSWLGGAPVEGFRAAVSAHIGDGVAPLKPGAAELLAHLDERGIPYALATSSGPEWVAKHFAAHGLGPRFRAAITREDVARGKPDPEGYLRAAARLGRAPADVLALEDSPAGLAAAHAAGMMPVLVPDLLPPDADTRRLALHVAASLHDVLALLRG